MSSFWYGGFPEQGIPWYGNVQAKTGVFILVWRFSKARLPGHINVQANTGYLHSGMTVFLSEAYLGTEMLWPTRGVFGLVCSCVFSRKDRRAVLLLQVVARRCILCVAHAHAATVAACGL